MYSLEKKFEKVNYIKYKLKKKFGKLIIQL